MATPNDRRVIYGASVIPQEAIVREEGFITYKLDATVAKRFGGKGSVDIHSNQAIDGWVSFTHPFETWELESDTNWEDIHNIWDGELSVETSASTLRTDSVNINFLYVKNLGSVECKLALEGDEFDILIPGGASVSMRVNSQSSDNIKVVTASSTTTIEYVIAKES